MTREDLEKLQAELQEAQRSLEAQYHQVTGQLQLVAAMLTKLADDAAEKETAGVAGDES